MNTVETIEEIEFRGRLPVRRWWFALCALVWVGAGVWTTRIVYEETSLSWRSGPQMIGFSWGHTFGIPFLYCWAAAHILVVYLAYRILWSRNIRPSRRARWFASALLLTLVLAPTWIPASVLLRWTMQAHGPGQHAPEFYVVAAGRGDLAFMHYIESVGAAVDRSAALDCAAIGGRSEVVKELLQRGADPNVRRGVLDRTALMNAAEMDYPGVVSLLLGGGADPNLKDAHGETALDIASRHGRPATADLLRSAAERK